MRLNTVQRHTKLFESNRIFFLLLVIIFGKYFLKDSIEVKKHLCLHFLYFINHLSIRKEIHYQISSYRLSNNLNIILFSSCRKMFIIYARFMICLAYFFLHCSTWHIIFERVISIFIKLILAEKINLFLTKIYTRTCFYFITYIFLWNKNKKTKFKPN